MKRTSAPETDAKMSAEERKWQAETDARALMLAREVLGDKRRLAAAKQHIVESQAAAKGALEMIKDG